MPLVPLRQALAGWTPGPERVGDPLHAIAIAWPGIVGPNVAAHAAPLEINAATLVVATRSSAWSQQLQFLSPTILRGLAAIALERPIERLSFRSGTLRRATSRPAGAPASERPRRRSTEPAPEPAHDAHEALEQLRRRLASLRRARAFCSHCGAPLGSRSLRVCAPCGGALERDRAMRLERIVYMAPWLDLAELREQIPALSAAEFERARRNLLQRWWQILERAKRAQKISPSGLERHVASSYVLLQSRLAPDRITPAIVRNLLGPELEALLWPAAADKANPAVSTNTAS